MASAAWRISCGTPRTASRVVTITTGRMSNANVRPAVRMDWPSAKACTNKPTASNPKMMDGTPAKLLTAISMALVMKFFGAYSSR